MLFNSFLFIFGFLPLTLVVFYGLGRWRQDAAKLALTVLSLGFYAWWRPVYLPILLFSILFNFLVGDVIQRNYRTGKSSWTTFWLAFGIVIDVLLLGWFKYANFVAENLRAVGFDVRLAHIVLPLAISFFTFQKIAYLVDSAQGKVKSMRLLDFALFASFFPQLLAGPIVHYAEVVPQLARRTFSRISWRNVLIGLAIFSIGLFKKTVIADDLATFVDPFFAVVDRGHHLSVLQAWLAAMTYTFQIYFDFSGYSPLRARSIIDYWRRWHMSLQRFLVSYVFTPIALPLNRLAARLQMPDWGNFAVGLTAPTVATFLISGLWHGAGWTFILWGALHAIYICINEVWREWQRRAARARRRAKLPERKSGALSIMSYHVVTFTAILFAGVMFRARSVDAAFSIWWSMFGTRHQSVVTAPQLGHSLVTLIVFCFLIVFMMPNTQQIMSRFDPASNWSEWRNTAPALLRWVWSPTPLGLAYIGLLLFLGIMFIQRGQAVFIYFNF
jgi:D-alanyl-lipoteichoic acid acyltransferase DltB (MBOAT superfamily)